MEAILQFLIVACAIFSAYGEVCPFTSLSTFPNGTTDADTPDREDYNEALSDLDIKSVFQDLYALMTDSQDCWPADTLGVDPKTHYGGLFIRLTWHCAGTFRDTDGVGGCSGGRQRFDPEASWDDNTNLDKARALLYPIKEKYGDALSWGDLIVFAGTAAIIDMGGPATEVCAGRVDDPDGTNSEPLGFNNDPGSAQPPCTDQGNCNVDNEVIGASTVGLIYVNPQGVVVEGTPNPDPVMSAGRIREIFGRMGMNDSETVALIGGGHAFGKSHGACNNEDAAGEPPVDNPEAPWQGTCDENDEYPMGKGTNTFTSGIEGQWTSQPFVWDNEYFQYLSQHEASNRTLYELIDQANSSGGAFQWENQNNGYLMLTTDLALLEDESYKEIVEEFASSQEALDIAFGAVWEKLMTQGGSWANNTFCIDASELVIDEGGGSDDSGLSDEEITIISVVVGVVVLIILGAILYKFYIKPRNKEKRLRDYENMDNQEKPKYGATELGATDEK